MIAREDRDGVRIVRMTHGKPNALDVELLAALRSEMQAVASDPGARAAVLTSASSIFCAGLDLRRLVAGGEAYVSELLPALEGALEAVFTCPKPVIAAINGHAVAGGYVLASACDRRIMSEGSGRVGLPELHVGVPFPTLVLEILRSTLSPQRLQEVLLVGATVPASDALQFGLVDEVVAQDTLLETAVATATRLAGLPPAAYALTKRNLRRPAIEAWRANASGGDAEVVAQWKDPVTLEAIRRFVEKTLK